MLVIDTPSPNFGDRRDGSAVTMLVFHYTGMRSADDSLARLCDPVAEVSAHYLITELGDIHQLVSEHKRAWHAGLGQWRGERDVNSRSIGIELQNPGHEFGYKTFPGVQIDSLIELSRDILERHDIQASGIVGHSDIAPDRKQDPGELFPWRELAQAGIGVFPEAGIDTQETLDALLTQIGYDPGAENRISAFQRRFRPGQIDGQSDTICCSLAAAYLAALSQ
ncbi:MAG: N-acetylmuramoyl-L-alanine amidase [Alphaproteobacteria bacterium]|nr:N-acetylmuramoyl-L-alanine amidase [Alphaproteobacteria bacterium]